MRTTYIANSSEAANLHSGKQTATVTLVKPQPKDCFSIHQLAEELCRWRNEPMTMVHSHDNNGRFFCKYCGNGCNYDNDFKGIQATYQPGQTIAVRETCYEYGEYKMLSIGETGDAELTFCSDWRYEYGSERPIKSNRVISAARMPRKAVRTHLLVKDVLCVRVQDMTSEQAQAIWPDIGNIERMQELHRKFGSGTWENNVFIFITTIEKNEQLDRRKK